MANILFICGSLNQTTQMHQIARHLADEHACYFTPYYADGLEDLAARLGLLNFTVLGGRHRRETEAYLAQHRLPVDWRGEGRDYDFVFTCSDLIIQNNIRRKRIALVQEGITEPESLMFHLVKWLKWPRYLANTSTNGLSDAYEIFFVASPGYADLFVRKGARREKIAVTGIPNFDNFKRFCQNDFPYRGYTLAITTPLRETFRFDNRPAFLQQCVGFAGDDPLIFKLHPTENAERAAREIQREAPGALVLTHGDIGPMIANAKKVITQQSTATFIAVGLGKETRSRLNLEELRRLMPLQNGGTSAAHIAKIAAEALRRPAPQPAKARRKVQVFPV